MADVVLDGVSKSFGRDIAVADISMEVPDGAFVVLLGPTGAGKTTTLRLISGLEEPDRGDIRIAGHSVAGLTPAQRDVAMVFQQYSLYPHMTVRENLRDLGYGSAICSLPRATQYRAGDTQLLGKNLGTCSKRCLAYRDDDN